MAKFDDMLKDLQNIKEGIYDWEDGLPQFIYEKYFDDGFKKVAQGLDVDKHRWYEITTTIIKIYDRFLGIRGVTGLFSESMDIADCGVSLEFFEMREIQTTSYIEA
jgi:hypothetical protein